jgi:hypothetical protein
MAATPEAGDGTFLSSGERTAPSTHSAAPAPEAGNGMFLSPDERTAPSTHRAAAPGPELTGHVHDRAGRPVDAVLTLVDGGGHQVTRGATGADGAYRLTAGPAAGAGLLVVRGRDGGSAPAVVSVILGVSGTHDVELDTDGAHRPAAARRTVPVNGKAV